MARDRNIIDNFGVPEYATFADLPPASDIGAELAYVRDVRLHYKSDKITWSDTEGAGTLIPGAIYDGVTDDTAAFQAFADIMSDGTVVYIPHKKTLKISEVIISAVNITITGGGSVDGTIYFRHRNYLTANSLNSDFNVHNIMFINPSLAASRAAIKICSSRIGRIYNNSFYDVSDCILIPENTFNNYGQHVNQINIYNNIYQGVDNFVRVVPTAGIVASIADSLINYNEGMAAVRHIDINTFDGLTVAGNIMFFSGNLLESAVKCQNVALTYGTWLQVYGNKFFEAGLEGLLLDQCSNFNVFGNVYAWPGQRLESSAIRITGTPLGGNYYNLGTVHDENIREPSGSGILIEAKSGRLKITSNTVHRPSSPDRYYGAPALSGLKYGIHENSADILRVNCSDNEVGYGTHLLVTGLNGANRNSINTSDFAGDGSGTARETVQSVLTLSTTATTISGTYWDIVNVTQPSPVSITDITNVRTAKMLTLVFFNGNTTIVHNAAKIILAGSADVTPVAGDTLTFWCETNGIAKEVSRAI